jgi:O-antigen/teichoic acid export membrane protein
MAHQRPNKEWSRERILFHSKRLSVNALLQICSQVLPLLAGAVAIPLLYTRIGRDDFGVFTIGLSALGLFSLLDLGLGRAAVRFMARAFADGDFTAAASVAVHSALVLFLFSLVLSIVSFCAIPLAAAHWFHAATQIHQPLKQCLYILILALPIAGLTSVFRAVLEAKERFLVISIIQVFLGVLTYIVPLVLSFATKDIRFIIAGAVACRGFAFVAFLIAAVMAWQGSFAWSKVDLKAQKEFRHFSFWMVLSNIVGSSIVYGDRALLVKMFELTEIPFYNVPLELLGRLMIVVNSAATVAFPALSRAADNKDLFEDVYVTLTTLLSILTGLTFLGLSLLTPLGLHLWLGDEFRDHSTVTVRVLLAGVAFQTLNVFALASLNARGFARPITYMHLVETPIYFWAMYRCGSIFGLTGVAGVWSSRLFVEYVCFAVFQIRLGAAEGARRRVVGSMMAACNALPLAILAVGGNALVSVLALGVSLLLSSSWVSMRLRKSQI